MVTRDHASEASLVGSATASFKGVEVTHDTVKEGKVVGGKIAFG